ncbi:MAG TPA: response regulator [Dehalococcoidales bacterium]|nr:response regulator [Dehalococcoidales bacterium]
MSDRQRILLVDDDQDMLRLLNRTLEMEGFDTVIVADGDSAINLMDKIEPDLVILDTMMPRLDSFQILDQLREHSDVPIIMLTTEYEVQSLRKALSRGADDFIRKPFGMRTFIARIRAKLRRSRQKTT